jgi:hydroxymethylglutaryl-CoA lyase
VAAQAGEILGVMTASETYNLKNQNMTLERGVESAIETFRIADAAHIPFVMAIGMACWCAYEGRIPEARVLDLVEQLRNGGIRRFYLAGSLGMEDPRHVNTLIRMALERFPDIEVGFHVHNMAGNGTANIVAALAAKDIALLLDIPCRSYAVACGTRSDILRKDFKIPGAAA